MLNGVFVALLTAAVVYGAFAGTLDDVATASATMAKKAVELVIGLIGVMAFWLGMMRILQRAGLVQSLARAARPVLTRLFPGVPAEHPAMSMMVMNISANALGLGNAATPFGLKAMVELDKLNDKPGTATDDMALFLAINTSGLAILPTTMIALRTSLGSSEPGAIVVTTLLATAASTTVAIVAAALLRRFWPRAPVEGVSAPGPIVDERASLDDAERSAKEELRPVARPGRGRVALGVALMLLVVGAVSAAAVSRAQDDGALEAVRVLTAEWVLAVLIALFVLAGFSRGVAVFDELVEGAREAFTIALKFVPYFIALIVAIGMFRASGAIDAATRALAPLLETIGLPGPALPMALIRPFSGKGALGVAAETMEAHGPDSFVGFVVSTMQGSTETTFYVLALYFGVVSVRNVRHTLIACLLADLTGVIAAVWACRWLLTT